MNEGLRRLRGDLKHCLDLFSDQRHSDFNFDDFAAKARGITWIDSRGKGGDRTVHSYVGNGNLESLSNFIGDDYAQVLQRADGSMTHKVAIGTTWYAELDSDTRTATAIHEGLHVYFNVGDDQLKTWLKKLGFTPGYGNNPAALSSHDITAWIKDGCK